MNEQNQSTPDSQWGERCSVKLDILLSRVDKLTGLLFHLKGTFTVEDAAMYLGITSSHLYKLVRKHDIPHSRPTNGRIFFNKEDLDKWIKSRMVTEPESADMPDDSEQMHEHYY
jgi:excisionase family DNA binding protein